MRNATRALLPQAPSSPASLLGVTLLCAAVAGCSSEEDEPSEAFVTRSTGHAAASFIESLRTDGDWLAYRLSEAGQGNEDLNGDGDTSDAVAVRVNTKSRQIDVLGVAALELALVNETLFILVDEAADDVDWNGDMDKADRVLLYHAIGGPAPVFYDTVPDGLSSGLVSAADRLLYPSATAPTAEMESNLFLAAVPVKGAAPAAPEMVLTGTDPNTDGVSYSIHSEVSGLVFLVADESVDGDLNGDGDGVDADVLAVVDAGAVTPQIVSAALSLDTASAPDAVALETAGEWLVAFLVDEASQGANLNAPGDFNPLWQPVQCAGLGDTDQTDSVLHWFQLTDLMSGTPAVNTGLVGDDQAYAMIDQYVGTVTPEASEGSGDGCDLNFDGDFDDDVFRWVAASNPAADPLPPTQVPVLLAVRDDLPGGTGGVLALEDTWVIVVDEADDSRNHDGDPSKDRDLVAAYVPSSSSSWNFDHGSQATTPVAATWMQPDVEDPTRFFAAVTEESLKLGNPSYPGNEDGDDDDSISTIPAVFFGNRLEFPGIRVAVAPALSGLRAKQNVAVHRVSEADQGNSDINGDGDSNDLVLQRFSLTGAFSSTYFATSGSAPDPATTFELGSAAFGAFMTSELAADVDLNGDGDLADYVVRYFRLP